MKNADFLLSLKNFIFTHTGDLFYLLIAFQCGIVNDDSCSVDIYKISCAFDLSVIFFPFF